MKLDRRLNLVIPIERDDGSTLYVHSMPLSQEVFERFYLILAKTWSTITSQGILLSGPRVAALTMRDLAQRMEYGERDGEKITAWNEPNGVRDGLMAEMRRLSNVALAGAKGWETIPLEDALSRGFIDAQDAREVENAQTFFIVVSSMLNRREAPDVLEGAAKLWNAQLSSLNCTAFAASLPT